MVPSRLPLSDQRAALLLGALALGPPACATAVSAPPGEPPPAGSSGLAFAPASSTPSARPDASTAPSSGFAPMPDASRPAARPVSTEGYPPLAPLPPNADNCGASRRPDKGAPGILLGRIATAPISQILRRHSKQLRACYETGLAHDPSLEGRLSVTFSLRTDGTVCRVKTRSATLSNPWVEGCIERVFYAMAFPSPPDTMTITYPLQFASAE